MKRRNFIKKASATSLGFAAFSTSLVFAQNSSQLSDSIIKYKQINPTLALDYGIQYNNLVLDIKPNNEIQQVFGAIGEILSNMGLDAAALDYLKRSIKLYEALPEKEKKFPFLLEEQDYILKH